MEIMSKKLAQEIFWEEVAGKLVRTSCKAQDKHTLLNVHNVNTHTRPPCSSAFDFHLFPHTGTHDTHSKHETPNVKVGSIKNRQECKSP